MNNGQIIVCSEEDVTSEEGEELPVGGRESRDLRRESVLTEPLHQW